MANGDKARIDQVQRPADQVTIPPARDADVHMKARGEKPEVQRSDKQTDQLADKTPPHSDADVHMKARGSGTDKGQGTKAQQTDKVPGPGTDKGQGTKAQQTDKAPGPGTDKGQGTKAQQTDKVPGSGTDKGQGTKAQQTNKVSGSGIDKGQGTKAQQTDKAPGPGTDKGQGAKPPQTDKAPGSGTDRGLELKINIKAQEEHEEWKRYYGIALQGTSGRYDNPELASTKASEISEQANKLLEHRVLTKGSPSELFLDSFRNALQGASGKYEKPAEAALKAFQIAEASEPEAARMKTKLLQQYQGSRTVRLSDL